VSRLFTNYGILDSFLSPHRSPRSVTAIALLFYVYSSLCSVRPSGAENMEFVGGGKSVVPPFKNPEPKKKSPRWISLIV
jgi:hypothetical protein